MKGDFSKLTFNPEKDFLRVLLQQGKVLLDADWNEQAAIFLHYMQTLAADLIGPYAGPEGNAGFEITDDSKTADFAIGQGRYYIDGILCENHYKTSYFNQPNYPLNKEKDVLSSNAYLVYLDVWERHITYLEDDDIREKVLNGIDTTTRSKVIWQVKVKVLEQQQTGLDAISELQSERGLNEAYLRAWAKPGDTMPDAACCQHPEAQYRGAENQLYRIEIHKPDSDNPEASPTFKWSRDNGAIVFPVTGIDVAEKTTTVTLENLGRDDRLTLTVNDWVELSDDESVLKNIANPLYQVLAIDLMTGTIILSGISPFTYSKNNHPLLRRWDQKTGDSNGIPIPTSNSSAPTSWTPEAGIEIEAGIKIEFQLDGDKVLRTGDYWLIPAIVTTREVEWPTNNNRPVFMSPCGVEHHYAPLATITVTEQGIVNVSDVRYSFKPLSYITVENQSIVNVSDVRCSFKPLLYSCYYSYYGSFGQGIGTDLLCANDNAAEA